jgi:hypothetical protein
MASKKPTVQGYGFVEDDAAVKKLRSLFFKKGRDGGVHCLRDIEAMLLSSGDPFLSLVEFKVLVRKLQKEENTPEEDMLLGDEMKRLYNMLDASRSGEVKFDYFFRSLRVRNISGTYSGRLSIFYPILNTYCCQTFLDFCNIGPYASRKAKACRSSLSKG